MIFNPLRPHNNRYVTVALGLFYITYMIMRSDLSSVFQTESVHFRVIYDVSCFY